MKKKTTTLPEFIRHLGAPEVAKAMGCDNSLPYRWAKGAMPGRKNALALVALADQHDFTLTLAIILGGAK